MQRRAQSLELDRGIAAVIRTDSHEAPDRHRRSFDRSPLVARFDLRGAMARLID
jgi:hypothetical protein